MTLRNTGSHVSCGGTEKVVRERKVEALVIVAPPRTLADLRGAFHNDVKRRIVAELHKDLTKHPVYEIEKQFSPDLQDGYFAIRAPSLRWWDG